MTKCAIYPHYVSLASGEGIIYLYVWYDSWLLPYIHVWQCAHLVKCKFLFFSVSLAIVSLVKIVDK